MDSFQYVLSLYLGDKFMINKIFFIIISFVILSCSSNSLHKKAYQNNSDIKISDDDFDKVLYQDKNGDTALHIAIMRGNLDSAKALMSNLARTQLQSENSKGYRAADYALFLNTTYFNDSEIDGLEKVNKIYENKKAIFQLGAEKSKGDSLSLRYFKHNNRTMNQLTLGIETFRSDQNFMNFIIDSFKAEWKSRENIKILMAASMGASEQSISLADKLGIKLTQINKEDYSPIHISVIYDCIPCVDILLKRGVSVNAQGINQLRGNKIYNTGTPLDYANSDRMKEFLLKKGGKKSDADITQFQSFETKIKFEK